MAMTNYYRALGVEDYCTDQDKIKDAYRRQIKFFHPDSKNVTPEIADSKTKELNAAYDVLSNAQKKQIYDTQLRLERGGNKNDAIYSNQSNNSNSTSYTYNNTAQTSTTTGSSRNRTNRYSGSYNSPERTIRAWAGLLILFLIGGIISSVSGTGNSSSGAVPSSSTGTNTPMSSTLPEVFDVNPDADLTPVSITNGSILEYPSDERVAPLTVETSGSNGYYIFLVDISNSGKNNMSFFVEGGKTVEIDVPLGKYGFYYCSGKTWYGKDHKFGTYTSYSKADGEFNFYVSGDYVYGHTITLYTVANGNLETESINESQFPG